MIIKVTNGQKRKLREWNYGKLNFYLINLKMVNCGKKHRIFRLSNQEMICGMCLSAL